MDLNNAINSRWPQNGYGKPMHEMPCLPQDIWNVVLKYSKSDLVALSCASQSLNKFVKDYAKNIVPADCFGAKEWMSFGADPMVALPVPLKMIQDFDSLKWMLTWIPETINGKELTLSSIDQFVSDSKNGKDAFKSNYRYPQINCFNKTVKPFKAHWVMLSKDVLDGTRNQNFATQEKLVREAGFEIPNLIDVVASVLLHNLQTGEFVYPDKPNHEGVRMRVQEEVRTGCQVIVGGFSALGLIVNGDEFEYIICNSGVSCARKSIGT